MAAAVVGGTHAAGTGLAPVLARGPADRAMAAVGFPEVSPLGWVVVIIL